MSDISEKARTADVTSKEPDLRDSVLRSSTTNPAIQRLQARVLAGAQTGEVITSYDRMHHRHNRS